MSKPSMAEKAEAARQRLATAVTQNRVEQDWDGVDLFSLASLNNWIYRQKRVLGEVYRGRVALSGGEQVADAPTAVTVEGQLAELKRAQANLIALQDGCDMYHLRVAILAVGDAIEGLKTVIDRTAEKAGEASD